MDNGRGSVMRERVGISRNCSFAPQPIGTRRHIIRSSRRWLSHCACAAVAVAMLACSGGEETEGAGANGGANRAEGGSNASAGSMGRAGAGASGAQASTDNPGGIGAERDAGEDGARDRDAGSGLSGSGGAGSTTATRGDCAPATFSELFVTCRSNADCASTETCAPEVPPPPQCGSPCSGCVPRCTSDSECQGGICVSSAQFPQLNTCAPSCTSAGCPSGYSCESDGRCKPEACGAGYSCPTATRCNADAPNADLHGCEPIPCDEPGGAACVAPAVCTRDAPRQAAGELGCAFVPCDDPRHPGCGVNMRCDAAMGSGEAACTRKSCTSDQDCDCGACIDRGGLGRLCYDHVGACINSRPLACPP